MADKAILFDTSKCIACRACQVACKQWNELGAEANATCQGTYENPPDLTHRTWLKMEFREMEENGNIRWLFTRRACMHCTEAACIKVCPTGSLYRHDLGFVAYDKDTCSGCGYCIEFCPFHVPRSERNMATGIAKMDKCVLCTQPGMDRLAAGYQPACVKTCPPNALVFGDRKEMLEKGKALVASFKANGRQNAYLYGEKELGGLHVLYALDDSPEAYGLPVDPQVPVSVTVKNVVEPLGWALGGMAILGLGLNFLLAREAKLTRDLPGKKEKK